MITSTEDSYFNLKNSQFRELKITNLYNQLLNLHKIYEIAKFIHAPKLKNTESFIKTFVDNVKSL